WASVPSVACWLVSLIAPSCPRPPQAVTATRFTLHLRLSLMLRVVLLCCVLLLLITAAGVPASAQTGAPVEGMKDYTLILVDAETAGELSEARDFIAASGGAVAIVLPPKAIFGWVTPAVEARIVGQHRIRAVHRSLINTPPAR